MTGACGIDVCLIATLQDVVYVYVGVYDANVSQTITFGAHIEVYIKAYYVLYLGGLAFDSGLFSKSLLS